jgi:hypothetical protein
MSVISTDTIEESYEDLFNRINDVLIESKATTNLAIGVMASLIVEASAMISGSVGTDAANKEFYSLITAMEKSYAAAIAMFDTEGETMQ